MELAKLVESSRQVLLVTGIWPVKNPSIFYGIKTFITMTIVLVLCTCMFINAGYSSEDFLTLSESMYLTMSVVNAIPKKIVMVAKKEQIFKLFETFEVPSFNKYLTVYNTDFQKYIRTIKVITFCFRAQIVGFMIAITFFPVIEQKPLPIDFPFLHNGSYHYPFYIFELVAISSAAFHSMTMDIFIIGIFSVAAVQLKILNKKLRNINANVKLLPGYSEDKMEEYTFAYLKECCIHYSDIDEFIRNILEIFSGVIFVQLSSSVVAICNAGFILTLTPVSIEAVSLYCYLGALFLQLGLYCWFGNDIYFESQQINTSCYMSQWYENGPKVRKGMLILMERCKRSLEIKAYNYIPLSFNTFISILKWSYSYFTLLRNMTFDKGTAIMDK